MEKTTKKTTPLKAKERKIGVSESVKPEIREKYIEMIGRRKTAVARVRIYPEAKNAEMKVNDKSLAGYFSLAKYQKTIQSPMAAVDKKFSFSVLVKGGGPMAQAEAIRLGLSRILLTINPEWRSRLKGMGFLRRDPRMVERKHYGLRKARRAQQWRKR